MSHQRNFAPDRSSPPTPGAIRPFRFPAFVRRTLPGGLTVLAGRQAGAPLSNLQLLFPAGGAHTPPGAAGLAALTAMLLDEGTRQSSALEIAARVESLGSSLSSGADWDASYVGTELLTRHTGEGLRLIAEVASQPEFPPEELERLRRQRLGELLHRRADPVFMARERFSREVYGDRPYGLPLIGTQESLEAIDREAVLGFYRRHYRLEGAFAVAVGDIDPERLMGELEPLLTDLPPGPPPALPPLEPPAREGVRVHLVDRPGAAQTQLLMGHVGVPREHPDHLALVVASTLLGGKFTSRINLNLRERHGYTYGASSRLHGRLGPGPFNVASAVANPVAGAAAREVLGELRRIRREPVSPEELEDTQSYMIGVFPYTLQTVSGLAARLEILAVYGLPDDHYERFPDRVRAIDRERLQEVARRHLRPDSMVVVAVGPADELAPQFEGLGTVTVHAAETGRRHSAAAQSPPPGPVI